jgi:hypothetical protein
VSEYKLNYNQSNESCRLITKELFHLNEDLEDLRHRRIDAKKVCEDLSKDIIIKQQQYRKEAKECERIDKKFKQ